MPRYRSQRCELPDGSSVAFEFDTDLREWGEIWSPSVPPAPEGPYEEVGGLAYIRHFDSRWWAPVPEYVSPEILGEYLESRQAFFESLDKVGARRPDFVNLLRFTPKAGGDT